MKRLVLALGVLVLTLPASATAITIQGPAKYQHWANASLVPTPKGSVRLILKPCPGADQTVGACTTWDSRTIYLNESALGESTTHVLLLHELGHVFDMRQMEVSDRQGFRRLLGLHRFWQDWAGTQSPPQELFADAYVACALGEHEDIRYYYGYGYLYPRPEQHPEICHLIQRIATAVKRPGLLTTAFHRLRPRR